MGAGKVLPAGLRRVLSAEHVEGNLRFPSEICVSRLFYSFREKHADPISSFASL